MQQCFVMRFKTKHERETDSLKLLLEVNMFFESLLSEKRAGSFSNFLL